MSKTTLHRYGLLRDLPDQRDLLYAPAPIALPKAADLRAGMPPIVDQGALGSCTANAVAAALDFDRHKQGRPFEGPSRLFVYYNERKDQGTVASDSGASIRESVKAVTRYGACPESEWPYNIVKFTMKPTPKCYADAVAYECLSYLSIRQDETALKTTVAEGFPAVIGISVYSSFENATVAKSGTVPMPAKRERLLGGHAVCLVGYNDAKRRWLCRNSWGAGWGQAGYFTLPYAYLLSTGLSSDFWTLRSVK
jgi:C1A family cysteine protease